MAPHASDSANGVAGMQFAQGHLTCTGTEGVSYDDSTARGTCGRACLGDASLAAIAIIRQALAGHEQDNSAILPSELPVAGICGNLSDEPICKNLYDKSLSGRITHSLL